MTFRSKLLITNAFCYALTLLYFIGHFQAGGFLVSSNGHAVTQELELSESVYSNNGYAETASLLEQVYV